MAQYYTVEAAFPNKDRSTKQIIIQETQYGRMVKWFFKVKEQPTQKWLNVSRKEGAEVKPGDRLYGEIGQWPDGSPRFIRQRPPQDSAPQQGTAPSSAPSSVNLEARVTKIESFLSQRYGYNVGGQAAPQANTNNTNNDVQPVDFSAIEDLGF